jgi:cytochrome d ubiquinol oxidase subunit II
LNLLVTRRRYGVARLTAAVAVVAVLWGWAAGQYPFLIEGRLTISEGKGAHATLQALLATVIAGVVVIGPSLAWLLLLARRGDLGSSETSGENSTSGDPDLPRRRTTP